MMDEVVVSLQENGYFAAVIIKPPLYYKLRRLMWQFRDPSLFYNTCGGLLKRLAAVLCVLF